MRRAVAIVATLAAAVTGLWFAFTSTGKISKKRTRPPGPRVVAEALRPHAGLSISAAETDVVLLNLCTVRKDRLGPYGHDRPTTPILDLLADGGVTFNTNFAQAPWTRPSMGALLTGRWPRALHLDDRGPENTTSNVLAQRHTTLAERLSKGGYKAIGVIGNPHLREQFGFAQGFAAYRMPQEQGWAGETPSGRQIVSAALKMIQRVPSDQRLYLQVNILDAHEPLPNRPQLLPKMKSGPSETERARYDAALRSQDAQIGRLLAEVLQQRPNTLVVVATDHGEGLSLPTHHGPAHGNHLFRSTTETALIFWHPSLTRPGRVAGGLSMNIDVVPTVLELLGLAGDAQLDGQSQATVVRGETDDASHSAVFSETFFRTTHKSMIFDGTWQLIRDHNADTDKTDALFHSDDPHAMTDRIATESGVALELQRSLNVWEAQMNKLEAEGASETVAIDADQAAMLAELGYLDTP